MKELIAALAVLADPNASPDDKAAALDKLSAYFNAQLDADEADTADDAEAASEAASEAADEGEKPAKTSEAGDDKDEETSKEMTSALATIATLASRLDKIEKASAVGNRQRATSRVTLPRVPAKPAMSAQQTVTIDMIDRAAKNTIRMTGK
ncbi:MAG: hypothetical protein JWP97_5759 [Labilithrix sp.]|nr:hypothetical protein [Labilithrix sp.]